MSVTALGMVGPERMELINGADQSLRQRPKSETQTYERPDE